MGLVNSKSHPKGQSGSLGGQRSGHLLGLASHRHKDPQSGVEALSHPTLGISFPFIIPFQISKKATP